MLALLSSVTNLRLDGTLAAACIGAVIDCCNFLAWRPPPPRVMEAPFPQTLQRCGMPGCREWADYDEKLGESVSIMGIEAMFKVHKK